jgi:hypothetical protein
MLLGFLVAAATMMLSHDHGTDAAALPAGLLLVGLPAFDVALVVYSRRRRGVSVMSGGRDHLTHRLLSTVRTPGYVAFSLAVGQAALAAIAIGGHQSANWVLWAIAGVSVALAISAIPLLESLFSGRAVPTTTRPAAAEHEALPRVEASR